MPDIVTLAEAKQALNILPSDTSQDAELPLWVSHASEVMDGLTGPNITREVVEDHEAGGGTIILRHTPVVAVAAVTSYVSGVGTVWSVDDPTAVPPAYGYRVDKGAGLLESRSGRWPGLVRVVYTAGRATTQATLPAVVRVETLRLLQHNWQPSQLGIVSGPSGPLVGPGQTPGFAVPNIVRDNLAAAGLLRPRVGIA